MLNRKRGGYSSISSRRRRPAGSSKTSIAPRRNVNTYGSKQKKTSLSYLTPEVNYIVLETGGGGPINLVTDGEWSHIPFAERNGVPHTDYPYIPIGTSRYQKVANRCIIKSIQVKWSILSDYNTWGDFATFAFVMKHQANGITQNKNEIWGADSAEIGGFFKFRNPDFVKNYTILKTWNVDLRSTGEDNGTYGNVEVAGFIPTYKRGSFYLKRNDLYVNNDTGGIIAGCTGATYGLWATFGNLNAGWIQSEHMSFLASMKFTFVD